MYRLILQTIYSHILHLQCPLVEHILHTSLTREEDQLQNRALRVKTLNGIIVKLPFSVFSIHRKVINN